MEAYTENTNAYNQLFSDKNKYRAIRQKLEDHFFTSFIVRVIKINPYFRKTAFLHKI